RRSAFRQLLGVYPKEFLLSTSGTFNRGKNFGYLIEAMSALHKDGIKLLIIGDEVAPNGESSRLKSLTHQLGLDNVIIFTGWQSDPSPFVASSDVYVFPSRFEGSPNALLEALGCGVPCLGTEIDEITEVLRYEDLLFPLDCHEVLVNKIKRLRFDADFYQRARMLSHERCNHFLFDWEQEIVKMVTSGDTTSGDATPGDAAPGDAAPGDAASRDVTSGDATSDEGHAI
ncbi:MAG: glycosyltransferase, partial [bacterium]